MSPAQATVGHELPAHPLKRPRRGYVDTKARDLGMTTAELVSAFLQRLDDGDAEGVGELFAEEIDWYVPGREEVSWAGRRSRRAEVSEYFLTMWSHFEPGKSTATMDRILIDGSGAAVFATFEHTFIKSGRSLVNPMAMRLEVSDGEIVKMHLYEDTEAVSTAFFGCP